MIALGCIVLYLLAGVVFSGVWVGLKGEDDYIWEGVGTCCRVMLWPFAIFVLLSTESESLFKAWAERIEHNAQLRQKERELAIREREKALAEYERDVAEPEVIRRLG